MKIQLIIITRFTPRELGKDLMESNKNWEFRQKFELTESPFITEENNLIVFDGSELYVDGGPTQILNYEVVSNNIVSSLRKDNIKSDAFDFVFLLIHSGGIKELRALIHSKLPEIKIQSFRHIEDDIYNKIFLLINHARLGKDYKSLLYDVIEEKFQFSFNQKKNFLNLCFTSKPLPLELPNLLQDWVIDIDGEIILLKDYYAKFRDEAKNLTERHLESKLIELRDYLVKSRPLI